MIVPFKSNADPLIRKLESIFTLSESEREAILDLPIQVAEIKADQDIVREGDRPTRCVVLLDGVACTYKVAGDGKRQIVAFHVPGDTPDLQSLHLKVLDISVGTLTPCKVGFIRHEAVRDLCANYPRIASALWRNTLIDAAIFREWVMNIGRRNAYARISHLMCEVVVKFRAVDLAEGNVVPFPITQSELGDATGLSNVHVNRSIQEMRKNKLIALYDSTLKVLDWEGLQEAGQFDPTYLHLEDEAAAA